MYIVIYIAIYILIICEFSRLSQYKIHTQVNCFSIRKVNLEDAIKNATYYKYNQKISRIKFIIVLFVTKGERKGEG